MSFLLQRVRGGALTLAEVPGDVLRIGRGTRAALRSDNPAVSLDHATIALDAAGYAITDLGSITGTYVNGRPVESARLSKGDVIEIGDLRMEVQVADAAKPLFLRVTSTTVASAAQVDEEEVAAPKAEKRGGAVAAPKIDYVGAYRLKRPYLTKLSLMALLLIAGFAILAELTENPQNQVVFMPGGVSSAHLRAGSTDVARNCQACHDPFRGVTDAKCIACHRQEPHAPTERVHPQCLSCHAEHRGAVRLAMMSDTKCTSCHADLQAHDSRVIPSAARDPLDQGLPRSARNDTAMLHIRVFDETHPDIERPPDTNTLKFDHKLHLAARGVFNAEGRREVLQCAQCHKLVADKSGKWDPKPIAFASDCQRCHRLTFDARFPNAEVPHGGDPGIVYGFLGGIYSGDSSLATKSPEEVRRIFATRASRSAGESAVVSAEHVIKAKCTVCHELKTVSGRLVATRPVLPVRWIKHARFSHSEPHRECESCHAGARQSALTSDILLPRISACAACHAPRGGRPGSTCLTCHEYHERSKSSQTNLAAAVVPPARATTWLGGGRPGMLGWIFLAAIIVLLVVVLVPVAVALVRRVSRRAPPAPPARASRPTAPIPDIPTAKVPVVNAPPPPPPAPALDLTQSEYIAPPREGTEMVQWYGMLVCTSGPLEGKRFIVEEPGFYIGRDATLAQVVIPDNRISKRHVRIVVKDGRVHAIDQDSTNGTFLGKAGGERITDVQLRRGDTLILADNAATFTYQI